MRGPSDNYSIPTLNFPGFYRGVVLDNIDPDKNGRCKIRIAGVHSPDLTSASAITKDMLDWAEQASPVFGEGISAGGSFSVPKIGSHVWVFFEGGNYRKPIYFAYSFGLPGETYSNQRAFPVLADPNKVQSGNSDFVKSDGNSTYDNRKENVITGISTGSGSWDEPAPQTPADYGENIYLTSPSGVGIEIDTKVQSQRFTIHHPSGSFSEFQLKGDVIRKSAQNTYNITHCRSYSYSKGDNINCTDGARIKYTKLDQTHQIDGNDTLKVKKDQKITISQSQTVEVDLNQTTTVKGWQNIQVGAIQTIEVLGAGQQIKISGWQSETIGGAQNLIIKGAQTVSVTGITTHKHSGTFKEINVGGKTINNFGTYSVSTMGATTLFSGGIMTITGSLIFLG